MKVAAIALAVASFAAAGSALAADRATDLDYLKASRCKGIAEGVGSTDTAGLDAFLKTNGAGRVAYVSERASTEQDKAKRESRKTERRDRLTAELNGPCMAYMGPAKDLAVR